MSALSPISTSMRARGSRGGSRFALLAHVSSLYLDGCLSIIISVHVFLCSSVIYFKHSSSF